MGKQGHRDRAVIYMRQSTYREESISLELQESACREHARRSGYDVVGVEADPGISGRTFDRPAVRRVMAMVEAGRADVVVLWKWSRLSRSRKDWAVAADQVEQAGGRIESATEAIDTTTSTGRLARGVMVEFAAFESERIGDVWREAHARRVAQGKPINGKARFGYAYDREQQLHVPDPVTGPLLAKAYRRYIAGESVYALVRWLNDTGAAPAAGYGPAPRGWRDRTLRRVLDGGFGAGLITVHGQQLPGAHDGVITETEWAQYQQQRDARRGHSRTERSEYLLSGLMRCTECGSGISYQRRPEPERGPTIRCAAAKEGGTHQITRMQSQAQPVEDDVRTWVNDIAAAALDQRATLGTPTPRADPRDRLIGERERIYSAMTAMAMQLAEGVIGAEVYQRAVGQYEQRLQSIERELREATRVIVAPPASAAAAVDLARDWDLLAVTQRRTALRSIITQVSVTFASGSGPASITIDSPLTSRGD